jgi:hypothetical protein
MDVLPSPNRGRPSFATGQIGCLPQRNLSSSPRHPIADIQIFVAPIAQPHAQTIAGCISRHAPAPNFGQSTDRFIGNLDDAKALHEPGLKSRTNSEHRCLIILLALSFRS